MTHTTTNLSFAPGLHRLFTQLPGPSRKRHPNWYSYQLHYRNPDSRARGCAMTWIVTGGRQAYQIALERDAKGGLRAHCTCADAVYRGENDRRHICKHVRGLLALGQPQAEIAGPLGFESFVGGWR